MPVFAKPVPKSNAPSKSKGSYDAFGGKIPDVSDTLSGIDKAIKQTKEKPVKKVKKPASRCGCW
jgi:hypothetical protein